jgi:hypothetical protein
LVLGQALKDTASPQLTCAAAVLPLTDQVCSMPQLIINPDAAFGILLEARHYDAQVEQTDPDSGSNPSDDGGVDALESGSGTLHHELFSAMRDLNDDEQKDLISLIWLGRGDYSLSEWGEARLAAMDITRARFPRYVLGIPLVSDYLEDGLSQFNHSLSDYLDRH